MLRIVQLAGPAAAKAYYKTSDYYLGEGQELPGVWGGVGAERLGLRGTVRQEAFDRLCDNRDPVRGGQLTAHDKSNRRVGWDFNWHCPKSVTLVYELLQDDRVLDAFRDAVAAAMAEVERDLQTRVRLGGADADRATGNAVYATFVHLTARPVGGVPDPHLHAHCVVFNATRDPVEGKWKAAQIGDLKRHAGYYEAVMHNHLAAGLVRLGYGLRPEGRSFEVAGVSPALVRTFSRRTALIERLAESLGLNGAAKDGLGARTRERKTPNLSPEALRRHWIGRLSHDEREALKTLPGPERSLPDAAAAMAYALEHCFERSAVVPPLAVYETALRHGLGGVTPADLRPAGEAAGLLVYGDRATTRLALARDDRVVGFGRDGRGVCRRIAPGRPVPGTLDAGQARAVAAIWSSRDRVMLVRGPAGTGKTTMLRAAVDGVVAAGLPVRATALGSDAAAVLGRELGRPSSTLARFLVDRQSQEAARGGLVVVDEAGTVGTRQMVELIGVVERVDARLLLVGDAAQHGAVEAGAPFRALQELAGLPCAELTEVRRQRGTYKEAARRLSRGETDAALDLLSGLGWVREADDGERLAGVVADYLRAVGEGQSTLVVAPTHAEGEAITRHLRDALQARGTLAGDGRTFVRLVPEHLTAAERARLGTAGPPAPELIAQFHRNTGPYRAGQRVPVADLAPAVRLRSANYAVYRSAAVSLAVGDLVRITAAGKDRSGRHKLNTGARYAVAGFSRTGDICLDNGWVLDRSFGTLAHGYVTTSHAAQGSTAQVVIVSAPAAAFPATGRDTAYVALTRAQERAHLWTDDLTGFRAAARRDRQPANARDLVPAAGLSPAGPMAHALFLQRLRGLAAKAVERVRQWTTPREICHAR